VSSPGAGLPPLRRNRDFVLLQAGQLQSTAGTESTAIAYPLLVLATTHSAASAGIATFARLVPYAVFGLLAGVVADRWNRKHVMIASDLVRALAIASLVVALLLDRLTFAQITVVAFVEGTGFVFFNIAETGALRSVVPPAQLPAAAGAEQARLAIVSLAGAPLGGALFGVARGLPFAVDAASYLFSFVSLLAMRKPFQEERELDTSRLRSQIAEGFRWLWAQPFLRTCALIFALGNFALAGLLLAVLVIGKRQGLSSGEVGVLIATSARSRARSYPARSASSSRCAPFSSARSGPGPAAPRSSSGRASTCSWPACCRRHSSNPRRTRSSSATASR
jgi:MFS family permease